MSARRKSERDGGAASPRARTAAGRLVGQWDGPIAVFRGIPFAEPPVGDLRWRPPRPAAGWDGERDAHSFGPAPLQPEPPRDSAMYQSNFADRRALVMSEDCLYLNVWTPDPAPGAGLPVMIWIHGGGNRYGHGSQDIHDGGGTARRGVVVVTLNHRLGALGFLAHPGLAAEDDVGASGNYGTLDILAALTWVRANIAAFGGDADRVTLAGNSAGAAHICHLMASRSARPFFRAAIGQSASGVGRAEGPLPSQAEAQKHGLAYADGFGGRDIASLRRISGIELTVRGRFGPVVDGRVLTEATDDVFDAGRQHAVPLMVGTNLDEGTVYAAEGEDAGAAGRRPVRASRLALGTRPPGRRRTDLDVPLLPPPAAAARHARRRRLPHRRTPLRPGQPGSAPVLALAGRRPRTGGSHGRHLGALHHHGRPERRGPPRLAAVHRPRRHPGPRLR
ncbi:carboxylesterase family protein [Actinomadura madurae]|nr:carboxylesterase family protein [Actinomadura madurae]MCP9984828.1 carboxylesterase family protein [Actinomadura madurae]MCQ0021016.1 carboxylesterase family protein [Actinomadura madurae]